MVSQRWSSWGPEQHNSEAYSRIADWLAAHLLDGGEKLFMLADEADARYKSDILDMHRFREAVSYRS